jgi:predicted phosphate transport protein (TIGR00153 family)
MEERIKGWLSLRRKVNALELIKSHATAAYEVVSDLHFCIQTSLSGDIQQLELRFAELEQKEKEADALRRKISEELAKGELKPEERDYAMRLSRQIDLIADFAHGAARTLSFFRLFGLPDEVKERIRFMSSMVKECAGNVRDCIANVVDGNFEEAIKNIELVEDIETKMDGSYTSTKALLLNSKFPMDTPWQAIFLMDLLDSIEETSDRCEDTCDQARIIIVSSLTK